MKKLLLTLLATSSILFTSGCVFETVAPNEVGVLVENYGKDKEQDYSIVSGRVLKFALGSDLYTLPTHEQRNSLETPITVKSSDGTEFYVSLDYSYRVNEARASSVVQEHSALFKQEGTDFKKIETNTLNPAIQQIIKEVITNTSSASLMEQGGNAKFTTELRKQVNEEFNRRGFTLQSFSAVLDYDSKIKESKVKLSQADTQRNTLDSQIQTAEKELKLARIQAEIRLVNNSSITDKEIQKLTVEKWDGTLPTTALSDGSPLSLLKQSK